MLEFFRQWVINIVTLVLFIVMIEMLLPRGKMRKYAGLVTGTILIIAIVKPLIGLFGEDFDFIAAQTASSNSISKIQLEKDSKALEEEQMAQITEVYRRGIIEQLEQNVQEVEGIRDAEADIIINEDYQSAAFGEIKRVYISIAQDEGDGSPGGDIGRDTGGDGSPGIEKVEVVSIGKVNRKQSDEKSVSPELREKLEEKISRIFGIENENIIISQMQR